jgi:hypothetical protein
MGSPVRFRQGSLLQSLEPGQDGLVGDQTGPANTNLGGQVGGDHATEVASGVDADQQPWKSMRRTRSNVAGW